jgi:hypothetical protein
MQADSSKRRKRAAPGIYVQDGSYFAGFNEPGTKRWTFRKLDATNLRAAKRERTSLLAALQEGRAASRSTLTVGTCLDRYLATLEASGAREKTVRTMRGVADRHVRPTLGAMPGAEDHDRRRPRGDSRRVAPFRVDRDEGVSGHARRVRRRDS